MNGRINTRSAIDLAMSHGPHVVYAYRDADGEFVYVGRSKNPTRRQVQHASRSPWWTPHLTFVVLATMAAKFHAHHYEQALIAAYQPRFNRQTNPAWYATIDKLGQAVAS